MGDVSGCALPVNPGLSWVPLCPAALKEEAGPRVEPGVTVIGS